MTPLRILEEIRRNQWAILLPSLRAMLAVLEGEEIKADEYRYFHSVDAEQKEFMRASSLFGRAVNNTEYTSIDQNVGYLNVDGPIVPRATAFSRVSGMVSLDVLSKEFKALEENPSIDSIVHLMDTPGGAVTGTSDYVSLVRASHKKTYAFTWMAASSGYWIASANDIIVSPPTGINGSIGIILSLTDYSERDSKRGIRTIDIVSSQSPNKKPNLDDPEERVALQQMVDDTATVFVEAVAENRDVSPEDVLKKFGGGAMFVAKRAMEVGMIDLISDANTFAKNLTNKSSMSSFSPSAKADITPKATEDSMPNENEKSVPAAELKNAAEVKALTDKAAADERTRLQSIEALGTKFDGAHPAVKAAALKAINDHKFDDGATAETVSIHVVEAVSKAQINAVDATGQTRREAADIAATVDASRNDASGEQDKIAASEQRVNGLLEARKARLEKEYGLS